MVCLEVDAYNLVTRDWDVTGASPYIDNWDPTNKWVSTNVNAEIIDEFTYEDGVIQGRPTTVEITLWAKGVTAGANDKIEVWVYDGSSWNDAGDVTPTTTTPDKYPIDISAILNTWAKINAAKLRLIYTEV